MVAARLCAIEAEAYRELFAAMPAPMAAALGATVDSVGGATLLIAPGLPVTLFNRAIGLGVDRPATRTDVAAIVARFHAAGVERFWIHHGPHAAPAALAGWLVEAGLVAPAAGVVEVCPRHRGTDADRDRPHHRRSAGGARG